MCFPCIRPCCWGRGSSISQPDDSEWQVKKRSLSSLDRWKLWDKSEGLAMPRLEQRGTQHWSLNDIPKWKKNRLNESSKFNEKHTHRSRIWQAMPRTSFPGHNCANGLLTKQGHACTSQLLLLLLFIGKPQQAFKASLQGARDISW